MTNLYKQTLVKQIVGVDYDFPTASDLSALQYTFVALDGDELVVTCPSGAAPLGILQNAPVGTATKLAYATVRLAGFSKLVLAGTVVTTLPWIKPNTSGGTGIACTTDKDCYGAVAKSGGVSGDLILVEVSTGLYTV